MAELFDIKQFDSYREDNRREVKKAKGGLPGSLWETYSAFANCYGGVIILGVAENKDGTWYTTGLQKIDEAKLLKSFWDAINDRNRVSINLLQERDVLTYQLDQDLIIVIHVPAAQRAEKPVYLNNDLFGQTYRRNFEGDYRCTPLQVKAMLRDQVEESTDMAVLDTVPMSDLNYEAVHGYRNSHRSLHPGHSFERLDDEAYLRSIGAAKISSKDNKLHPTAAGMLMFGDEYNIICHFPEYFLDYQEQLNPAIKWTDRLNSASGEWSGNLFDFYFRVYNKLCKSIKVPYTTEGGIRMDDTPVHKAVREALANCLIHADYHGTRGIVIKQMPDKLVFANPGYIRTGKLQMRQGGESDPRNKVLMKMFNLLDIGERAGSGVPIIFNAWADEGWPEPEVEERFDPDRTVLTLNFMPQGRSKKRTLAKTLVYRQKLREYLQKNGPASSKELAQLLGLSPTQTTTILRSMDDIIASGATNKRRYSLKQ